MAFRTFILSVLFALPCFAQEQSVDSVVQVPIYENTPDVSKAVLGTIAAVSGKDFVAKEWDIKTNKVKKGGAKYFAQSNSSSSSSSSEGSEGNFIVTLAGSDMGHTEDNLPVAVGLGAKAAKGYMLVTGSVTVVGWGGDIMVSPIAGSKYPLKPIIGYRYFATHNTSQAHDDHHPYTIASAKGPTIGLMTKVNDTVDLMGQAVWATRTEEQRDYGHSEIVVGGPKTSTGWSFVGSIVFNIKSDY